MVLALLAFSDICDLHERPNLISSDWIRSITCTLMELLNQILYTIVVHRNLVPETYFANCNGRYQLRQNNAVAVTLYGWLQSIKKVCALGLADRVDLRVHAHDEIIETYSIYLSEGSQGQGSLEISHVQVSRHDRNVFASNLEYLRQVLRRLSLTQPNESEMRLFTLKISLAGQYPKSLAIEHFSTSFSSDRDYGDCFEPLSQGFSDTPYQYIHDNPDTEPKDTRFDYGHCECGDRRDISWILDLVNLKCPKCHRNIHSVCYGFQSNDDAEDVECYSCRRVQLMPHEIRGIMTVRKFYHYYWNVGCKRGLSLFNPSNRSHRLAVENLAINEDYYNLLVNWAFSNDMFKNGRLRRNAGTRDIGNHLMTESVQWLRSYLGDLCENRNGIEPVDPVDTIDTIETEIIEDTDLHLH